MSAAARIRVQGVVQGVGFRPFIHRHARDHRLCGWVRNTADGVLIEVEGPQRSIRHFYADLASKAPSQSRITGSDIENHAPRGYDTFEVRPSGETGDRTALIAPDTGICRECLREMTDPNDRRYRYPFINCTNCGPRFTIMEAIPYDRANTSMDPFTMCPRCHHEYTDILDRRYHAQPNACPACGPRMRLIPVTPDSASSDPIAAAVRRLSRGEIVAVKGLGGFHLACDATNGKAVDDLRRRKGREQGKPLAVMIRNLDTLRRFCHVTPEEERLLESPERPIVLLEKRNPCPIAEPVAPRNRRLGVMLPYTPLHCLLMDGPAEALVMTSGNICGEPLIADDRRALARLPLLADAILLHDRTIVNRCDDSVISVMAGSPVPLRRSRGYAPMPVILNREVKPTLAVGPELKNTVAVATKNLVFVSQHIGDLKNHETFSHFKDAIDRLKGFFRIRPEIIAHDLHPQYLSTRYALGCEADHIIPVQHHHAHIASCMAEHKLDGSVIGVAMDGTGYGTDGTIWGCEFLLAGYRDFERVGFLRPLPMPGGDKAVLEPDRMAISYLEAAVAPRAWRDDPLWAARWSRERIDGVLNMIHRTINSPLTSSAGRLFDAVASMIGLCDRTTYDAQASIELEMIIDPHVKRQYPYEIIETPEGLIIDPREIIRALVSDLKKGRPPGTLAAAFHQTVIALVVDMCRRLAGISSLDRVVLSGGVFQNRYLLEGTIPALQRAGFRVYTHTTVPPNDGGIALGQVVIANEVVRSCA